MRFKVKKIKIMCVFGTRPEAIKMCPLIKVLKKSEAIHCVVCLTGQHREMLQQVINVFDVNVDYNLDIMKPKQTLTTVTTSILEKIEPILESERPDIVLVHGDTTTSFAAALAAFYQKIPVGHVEAGLRTNDKYSPFPEEINRCITARIAELHFSPTQKNKQNLIEEKIYKNIYVTGNTVIDALYTTVKEDYHFKEKKLSEIDFKKKRVILLTAHRRENIGQPLVNICNAVKKIAYEFPDVIVVYPVHLNPAVSDTVFEILQRIPNIFLLNPLDVEDMHNIISRSYIVMTDSGGLQEEAPAFGVPVLVLRTETERPEAVEAGTVKIVGVEEMEIYSSIKNLLEDYSEYAIMAQAANPYGDGKASEKIMSSIVEWYLSRESKIDFE